MTKDLEIRRVQGGALLTDFEQCDETFTVGPNDIQGDGFRMRPLEKGPPSPDDEVVRCQMEKGHSKPSRYWPHGLHNGHSDVLKSMVAWGEVPE